MDFMIAFLIYIDKIKSPVPENTKGKNIHHLINFVSGSLVPSKINNP